MHCLIGRQLELVKVEFEKFADNLLSSIVESCLHHELNLLCDLGVEFEHPLKDLLCLLGQGDRLLLQMIFEATTPYEEPAKIHIAFEAPLIVFRLDELFSDEFLPLLA